MVRRTTTGILQADDLGIVKQSTISNVTEEMMITTPGYWLAPCLVALAAWIRDDQKTANIALNEAMSRDVEKTSLLFGLINRRAGRKNVCLKWIKKYLETQDPESIDRKTIIVLNAFAGGLFGVDTEGLITSEMQKWLDYLIDKPGFVEKQTDQWADAITLKIIDFEDDSYVYLPKYSNTWPLLKEVMSGAKLHNTLYTYFDDIFKQKPNNETVKKQLDDIMFSLANDYDKEETELKMKEKYSELIIKNNGDKDKADAEMDIEKTAFEEKKDFTQLLTDAAMKPDISHSSAATQKFAIALSKDWIIDGYQNVVATNRSKIPNEINFEVDGFKGITRDGENEGELVKDFNEYMNKLLEETLKKMVVSKGQLYFGIIMIILGILMISSGILGIVIAVIGAYMIYNYNKNVKNNEENKESTKKEFKDRIENEEQIIRAIIAEVVDYRDEFVNEDKNDKKVIEFLEQINASENVGQVDTTRRIITEKGEE